MVRKEKQEKRLIERLLNKPSTQTLNVQTQFSRSAFKPPGNTQQATTANRVLKTEPTSGFDREAWQANPTTAQRPQSVVQPLNGFNAEAWKPNG